MIKFTPSDLQNAIRLLSHALRRGQSIEIRAGEDLVETKFPGGFNYHRTQDLSDIIFRQAQEDKKVISILLISPEDDMLIKVIITDLDHHRRRLKTIGCRRVITLKTMLGLTEIWTQAKIVRTKKV